MDWETEMRMHCLSRVGLALGGECKVMHFPKNWSPLENGQLWTKMIYFVNVAELRSAFRKTQHSTSLRQIVDPTLQDKARWSGPVLQFCRTRTRLPRRSVLLCFVYILSGFVLFSLVLDACKGGLHWRVRTIGLIRKIRISAWIGFHTDSNSPS